MKTSRRSFFTKVSGALAVGAIAKFLPATALAEEKRRARPAAGGNAAGGAKPASDMVDPSSDTAKAVKYVNNKADIKDASVKTERQGVAFDKQFCHNCSFYTEKEAGKAGACTIFAGKLVNYNGFCTSWNKKA